MAAEEQLPFICQEIAEAVDEKERMLKKQIHELKQQHTQNMLEIERYKAEIKSLQKRIEEWEVSHWKLVVALTNLLEEKKKREESAQQSQVDWKLLPGTVSVANSPYFGLEKIWVDPDESCTTTCTYCGAKPEKINKMTADINFKCGSRYLTLYGWDRHCEGKETK